MPRISEINPETAPEAIQKIIADHLADGHALTAEKRTLLHNAVAFNAVEAGSYALDDELQRLIGKRAADFYEYAISQKNGCLVCSIYFQNLLKKNGIDTPVINIPCCPGNPEWIVAVLVEYLLMGRIPELNNNNEPKLMFNETVHDNCPRRGHFENGEFVYNFGSIEEEKGYCLYALGCKGPQTFTNCPIVKSNRHVSWCVEAGAPCVGCGVISPMNANGNWVDENTPFLARHRYFQILDWKVSPAAICGTVLGLVVGIIVVHAVGMKITKRTDGGADFEVEREYDVKHKTPGAAEAAAAADQLYEQLDADGVVERHANHKK